MVDRENVQIDLDTGTFYLQEQELYNLSSDIFIIETYLKYYPYKEEEKKLLKEELDRMIEYKERLEKEMRGEVLMTNEEAYKVADMVAERVTDIIDRNIYVKNCAIHDLKNIQDDMNHCIIDLSTYVAEIEKVIQKLDGCYEWEYKTNEEMES